MSPVENAYNLDDEEGFAPAGGEPVELEGIDKAALLLLALGPHDAAGILRHLDTAEVLRLGQTMAAMPTRERSMANAVIDELLEHVAKGPLIRADADQIREMFSKALGDELAGHLIQRVMPGTGAVAIENLKWMDAVAAADLIKNEHPQIIATILVHLDPEQAGKIIKRLPANQRGDIILRIATFDGVRPGVLKELDEALTRMMSGSSARNPSAAVGGLRAAAEMLNHVGPENEAAILERVRDYDPGLADKLVDEMFVFDKLNDVDDRSLQTLLREVQSETLVIALKGAQPGLRERIFNNMSARAAEMMREDLEVRGPVRVSELENAQKEVIRTARRLAEEGRIMLPRGSEDEYV